MMLNILKSKRFIAGTLAWFVMILSLHLGWTPEFETLVVASGTTLAGLLILGYTFEDIAAKSIERAIAITAATPSKTDDEILRRALNIFEAVGVIQSTGDPADPYKVDISRIQELYKRFLDRSR